MALIRSSFWLALFLASTFCFIVVFEHGFSNFAENSTKEVHALKAVVGLAGKKGAESAK